MSNFRSVGINFMRPNPTMKEGNPQKLFFCSHGHSHYHSYSQWTLNNPSVQSFQFLISQKTRPDLRPDNIFPLHLLWISYLLYSRQKMAVLHKFIHALEYAQNRLLMRVRSWPRSTNSWAPFQFACNKRQINQGARSKHFLKCCHV